MHPRINFISIIGILLCSFSSLGQDYINKVIFECKGINKDMSYHGIKNLDICISKTFNGGIMVVNLDKTVIGDNFINDWLDTLDFTKAKTKEDSSKVFAKNPFKLPPPTIITEEIQLSQKEFENVLEAVAKIKSDKLESLPEGTLVCGGNNCSIRYESEKGSEEEYYVWSPDVNTKKRGMFNFLRACKVILEYANIKPHKVF